MSPHKACAANERTPPTMAQHHHPIKGWFITISQIEPVETREFLLAQVTEKAILRSDKVLEYTVAEEKHEDGGRHFHAYFKFEKGVKLREVPEFFHVCQHTADCQPARSRRAVLVYVSKEDKNYLTNVDIEAEKKKQAKSINAAVCRKYTAKQAFEKGLINFGSIRNYRIARECVIAKEYEHHGTRGYWFYGSPGTGKTRAAMFSKLVIGKRFKKDVNKWFDGYEAQPIIVMDDFGSLDMPRSLVDRFGYYLKKWADRYPVTGEIKGSTVELQHTHFIVTSNYKLEEIFRDQEMLLALQRRFRVVHFQDVTVPFNQTNMYQTSGFESHHEPAASESSDSEPDQVVARTNELDAELDGETLGDEDSEYSLDE